MPGVDLDRDCIVQGAIDRDFDLRVHFAEPLQIQGLKWTFSYIEPRAMHAHNHVPATMEFDQGVTMSMSAV